MQVAKNRLDNSEQTASQFSQLTPDQLANWRGQIACSGCGATAYFRSVTRNDRAACFCGHHEVGCEFAATQSAAARASDPHAKGGAAINPSQRIVVDLAYGSQSINEFARPHACESHRTQSNHSERDDWATRTQTHRRPSSLLNDLIHSPQFNESRQPLVVQGIETTVSDFFVRLDDLSPENINQFHGYWGKIESACRGSTDELWLNSAGQGYPSVCVSRHLVDELLNRHGIHRIDLSLFSGAYVLVIGDLRTSLASKLYIEVKDLANIAFYFPSER